MNHSSRLLRASLCLLPILLSAPLAGAESEISTVRAELAALKTEYESRILALEQRLNAAEQQLAEAELTKGAATTATGAYTPPVGPGTSGNAFNPGIGVVLMGFARGFDKDPGDYQIPGAPLGGEAGPGEEGLSLGESELIYTANVDDWFFGRVTAAVEQEDGEFHYGLEEAFLDTLAMPANTTLRFGRFYSSVGYLNDKHAHTWDFADQALPYSAFLGGQYSDDGLQFRWLAPTDFYLELGAEVFRGDSFPAGGGTRNGLGTRSLFANVGGDIGIDSSWLAGLSWMDAEAGARNSGDEDEPLQFDGNTDLYIADFVWKWAPGGNFRQRNLVFQAEYLRRSETGDYLLPDTPGPLAIDTDAAGWYAQLVYQWRPRWRVGLRFDGLDIDDPGVQFAGSPLEPLGDDPRRYTAMVDYSNSEFSRLRLQLQRDESGLENNNQITLQYIMSIGAHGAHEF